MKKIIFSGLSYFTPLLAFAQIENTALGGFFTDIQSFINNVLIPLIFSIALLVFLYGTFKYFIAGSGNETTREEGKKFMLYAIIGFVLMVSIWGIVALVAGVIPAGGTIEPPSI